MSQAGGGVDCDAHGILILNPGDPGVVGDTVQGVVLDERSAGGWVGYSHTLQICLLEGSFGHKTSQKHTGTYFRTFQ